MKNILLFILSTPAIKRLIISALRELAKRSDTTIDDEIVDVIDELINDPEAAQKTVSKLRIKK